MSDKLYIADDNKEFGEFLSTVAGQDGWSVTLCTDGKELIDILAGEDGPALVILDIIMPGMDGIETVERLVNIDRPLRLRFVTGGSEVNAMAASLIASARNLNAGQTIRKPVSVAKFREILAEERAALQAAGK